MNKILVQNAFKDAFTKIKKSDIITRTTLQKSIRLSSEYDCNIFFKREDLQTTRSFKIRGAYNKITNCMGDSNSPIVTASAGNHAQGVAITCKSLGINHDIFVPETTPKQKINKIKEFGGNNLTLHVKGQNFDESSMYANELCKEKNGVFIHPFNDMEVIFGQGTVGIEIHEDIKPDMIICPIGGGGLAAGIGLFSKTIDENFITIGVEPENADSMKQSILNGKKTTIHNLNTFVDGASVKTVGSANLVICKKVLKNIYTVDNNMLSYDMVDIYQNEGIILEPAGALSVSCLRSLDRNEIRGRNIVCVLSGGNNDISRYPDIMEKSLLYKDLKHYFIVSFIQRPGELKKFINKILGENDDITRFEYLKKNNKDSGSVLIGIELQNSTDICNIIKNLEVSGLKYLKITEDDMIHSYLI